MNKQDFTLFEKFTQDDDAWEFFLTGPGGTGKTTDLAAFVGYCQLLDMPVHVCAYTHKACKVLRAKMPDNVDISTLDSFLKRRPSINEEAKLASKIETNTVVGRAENLPTILFIDEYSMVGEQSLMELRNLQDPEYEADVGMKIVWIGDPYQLPPVKDQEAVVAEEPYWVKLLEIKRSNKGNKLQDTIAEVIAMIDGTSKPARLKRHDTFKDVGKDLLTYYKRCKSSDKVFLAYTNYKVQEINFALADRDYPEKGDELFCSSVNRFYTFSRKVPYHEVKQIDRFWDEPLQFGSKYKTLEYIIENNMCEFFEVHDEDGVEYVFATTFGTYNAKRAKEEYGVAAANANKAIQKEFKTPAAQWSKTHYTHALARKRSKAWRDYLTFKDFACMDFSYAMTIHKSQGSTFEHVFLDAEDLSVCADNNMNLYLRLYYVAISRASQCVYTN